MKYVGKHLYPESPEEAMPFLGQDVAGQDENNDRMWWAIHGLSVADLVVNPRIRIHVDVAREALAYQEGETCCYVEDYRGIVIVSEFHPAIPGKLVLSYRAVFIAHNADQFRALYQFLYGGER